ncbi:MAG: hypothetical protein PHW69_08660 [Elusimicrobiaceae bacterium]|nr:hypothetical protein [Elusimicrobiaceae bacterium]
MTTDNHAQAKLKFKLPSGLEFEAEGSPEFVSGERDTFLKLAAATGFPCDTAVPRLSAGPGGEMPQKKSLSPSQKTACFRAHGAGSTSPQSHTDTQNQRTQPGSISVSAEHTDPQKIHNRRTASEYSHFQQSDTRQEESASPVPTRQAPDGFDEIAGNTGIIPFISKNTPDHEGSLNNDAQLAPGGQTPVCPTPNHPMPDYPQNDPGANPGLGHWEQISLIKDNLIILKARHSGFEAGDCALVLLAGARILLRKNSQTALELAKELRKSGYAKGRLDRILQSEIIQGRITSVGTKRSRFYALTGSGLARASRIAEHMAAATL